MRPWKPPSPHPPHQTSPLQSENFLKPPPSPHRSTASNPASHPLFSDPPRSADKPCSLPTARTASLAHPHSSPRSDPPPPKPRSASTPPPRPELFRPAHCHTQS